VLSTSREPLRVPDERVHRLASLAMPKLDDVPSIAEARAFSAVRLLWERATATDGDFEPSARAVSRLIEICHRWDGNPLELELAAQRIPHLGVQGLLRLLDDGFDVLVDTRELHNVRQRSLRSSFDWSYASLTATEQRALADLSVFSGAFSLRSGVVIAHREEREDIATDIIGELVSKSMVSVKISPIGLRYRLLRATREYARRALLEFDDHSSVQRKHATMLIDLLRIAADNRARLSPQTWFAQHASLLTEVKPALDWLARGRGDASLRMKLLAASAPIWSQLSAVTEYVDRAETALDAVDGVEETCADQHLAAVWSALGNARLHLRGPDEEAHFALLRALTLAERSADFRLRSMAHWGLGLHYGLTGRYAESLTHADLC
jgi:predicted ATPase